MNTPLASFFALLFLSSRIFAATPLHQYTFDGPQVVDSIGSANGSLVNGATVSSGALRLDGIDDFVQFEEKIIPVSGSFSVAFFAQEASLRNAYTEIISQGLSGASGFYIGYDPGRNFRIGDSLQSTGLQFPRDGLWHHYALTAGPSETRFYMDGSLVRTFPAIPMISGGGSTRLGRQFDTAAEFFHGNLDDLRVYSGILTTTEVEALIPPIYWGGDYGGRDWTPLPGQELAGTHGNIGTFTIPTGQLNYVRTFDGAQYGGLIIRAQRIVIDGVLDGTGRGYPGGPGGGGGGGADQPPVDGGNPGSGGNSGAVVFTAHPAGGGGAGGEPKGGNGGAGGLGSGPGQDSSAGAAGGRGTGADSSGDNPDGDPGGDGGYFHPGANNDPSATTDDVWNGSGGGGGGGGGGGHSLRVNSGGGGGGGGGAGGSGGAFVKLYASEQIKVAATGKILMRGALSNNGIAGQDGRSYNGPTENGGAGDGRKGGDAGPALSLQTGAGGSGGKGAEDTSGAENGQSSGRGGNGGAGGAGAGGGIVLHSLKVAIVGQVDNIGGRTRANGGTLKIFFAPGLSSINEASLRSDSGKLYLNSICTPPSFVQQPLPPGAPVCLGSAFQLCAQVSGESLTYQWFKNDAPIDGAVAPCLDLKSMQAADAGTYYVRASSFGACVTPSNPVQISIDCGAEFAGLVWNDKNGNGHLDSLIQGDQPHIIFVVDSSGSTEKAFAGRAVGNPDGDLPANTILDAELAATEALVNKLIDLGFGEKSRISIINFRDSIARVNLGPATDGNGFVPASADSNLNGHLDIKEFGFPGFAPGGDTDYSLALSEARKVVNGLVATNIAPSKINIIFLSDGQPNRGGDYASIAEDLRSRGINVRAFGAVQAGSSSTQSNEFLKALQLIAPSAKLYETTDEILDIFENLRNTDPNAEKGLGGKTVYLDLNDDQILDTSSEPFAITRAEVASTTAEELGQYLLRWENPRPGTYWVREVIDPGFEQTFPLAGKGHQVSIALGSRSSGLNFGVRASETIQAVHLRLVLLPSKEAQITIEGGVGNNIDLQRQPIGAIEWETVKQTKPGEADRTHKQAIRDAGYLFRAVVR